MKIGSKLCPVFVLNHKKYKPVFVAGTHVYFLVVRNQRRAEFWTEYHAFFCNRFRILTTSVLWAHFLKFLPRDLKKPHSKWLFLIHNKCGDLVSIFWSPWVKKKVELITLRPWGFWSSCNKPHAAARAFKILRATGLWAHFFCSGISKNSY